jgi:hypothetical protein
MATAPLRSFSWQVVSFLLVCAAPVFASDSIVIAGASTADGIALTTTSSTVRYPIFLQNTTSTEIKSVRVEISDLVSPDSHLQSVKLSTEGSSAKSGIVLMLDLPALQSVRILLETSVPQAGVYQSSLALIYDKKRYPFPLKITRSSLAPSVKLIGLDSASFEGLDIRSIFFSLQETSGADLKLRPPVLSSLSLKSGEKSLQAKFESAQMFLVAPNGAEQPITDPFPVPGNSTAKIRAQLTGLNDPGEYTASLDIGSADGSLPAQTVSIFVKRSGWLAALMIALGVVVSLLLRKYTRVDRPRLLLRRRLLLLVSDIDAMGDRMPDATDRAALKFQHDRLVRSEDDVQLGVTNSVDDIVADVNAKLSILPDLSTLRRKIDAVQPQSVADPFRGNLQSASNLIFAAGNATSQQIADTTKALQGAVAGLDAAIRACIVGQITEAQNATKDAPPSLTDVHREEFAAEVTAVLTKANDAAQLSPPNIDEAKDLIDRARRSAARIMVNDLQEKFVRPDEIKAETWAPYEKRFELAASQARGAKTGDEAMSSYHNADEAWLSGMIEALRSQALAVQDRAKKASEKDKQAFDVIMQEQLDALQKARDTLAAGDFTTARKAYNEAKGAILEGLKALPPAPSPKSMAFGEQRHVAARIFSLFSSPEMITIPGLSMSSSVEPMGGRAPRIFDPVKSIEKKISQRDLMVGVVAGVVAVVLGVFLLWIDNLTWGSPKDLVAAVLWGLGVHQIAGNAVFAKLDLGTLQDQLTGTTSQGGSDGKH